LTSLILGKQRTPDYLHDRPGSATRAETYRRLVTLTGALVTTLWAATIHRFAPTLTPPGSTVALLAVPAGGPLPLLDIGSRQKRLRPDSRGVFCPRCLAEAAYHRLIWIPFATAACLRHQTLLVSRCARCGAAPTVRDIVVATCRVCGADFTGCPAISVADDAFGVFTQRVLQAWLRGEPAPDASTFRLPDLPTNVAYRIVDGLRLLAHGAGFHWPYRHHGLDETESTDQGLFLTPAQSYTLYATALKALLRWPHGFEEFLDAYTTRELREEWPSGVSLGPKLGALYRDWLSRRWDHAAFDFLQDAFDRFLLRRFGQVHALRQLRRCQRDSALADRVPYLNRNQAARLMGAADQTVQGLLQSGRLTGYAALDEGWAEPPTLLSRSEVLVWREAWRDHPTIAEAARLLGVSYWVVRDLITCGFLPPPHQLADDAPGWRFNRTAIAACHARVTARITQRPPGAADDLTLAGAARLLHGLGLNAAALLVSVANGELAASHLPAMPIRLGDLRFRRTDLAAHAARVKAAHNWLGRRETAHRLGISEHALQRLVENGRLTPAPVSGHAHFFDRATVDAFGRDHINSTEAARLLGVGRNVVQRWTRWGRLPALSGPGIDGVHTYLFSRPALVHWRTERLSFGEAAAMLGVRKGVLRRWTDAGKIVPLADMGGKQRWFFRPDLLRLRAERLRMTDQPPTEPPRVSGGSAREGTCRN
jgi:predicted site-specific integrase-resolvase